jgi:DNA-directed RNA polymerase specialized sigma24 family protein
VLGASFGVSAVPVPNELPPVHDAPASPTDAPTTSPVPRAVVDVFLGKRSTQDRIYQVVRARVKKGTPEEQVDDLVQKANTRILEAKALPHQVESLRPWVSRLAVLTVIDHYRALKSAEDESYAVVSVEDLPPDDAVAEESFDTHGIDAGDPAFADADQPSRRATLVAWLGTVVTSRADRLTLEMLACKAKTDLSNADVAAEFGMTEAAFDNRLLRFKAKWVPAWQKERARRRRLGLLVLGILLLLVAVAFAKVVWPRLTERTPNDPVEPAPAPTQSAAVPSSSATGTPSAPRFNQALPPVRPVESPFDEKTVPPKR